MHKLQPVFDYITETTGMDGMNVWADRILFQCLEIDVPYNILGVTEDQVDNFLHWFDDRENKQSLIENVSPSTLYFNRADVHKLAINQAKEVGADRVLSAACSKGGEPYSIAIQSIAEGVPMHVDAFDINPGAIEKARSGFYLRHEIQDSIEQIGLADLLLYFEETSTGYQVRDHVRERVSFEVGSLLEPIDQSYGVVVCCNALKYLEQEYRDQAMSNLRNALDTDGRLIVGLVDVRRGLNLEGFVETNSPRIYQKV